MEDERKTTSGIGCLHRKRRMDSVSRLVDTRVLKVMKRAFNMTIVQVSLGMPGSLIGGVSSRSCGGLNAVHGCSHDGVGRDLIYVDCLRRAETPPALLSTRATVAGGLWSSFWGARLGKCPSCPQQSMQHHGWLHELHELNMDTSFTGLLRQ